MEDIKEKYIFQLKCCGRYLLKKEKIEPFEELQEYRNFYVDYPSTCYSEDMEWHFFTTIMSLNDGTEHHDNLDWELNFEEQERIKSYIRNVLKPNDLYEESEEREMREMTVLSFGVPNDLVDEVKSIVSRFEGVPVDANFKGDQNPLDVAEIERLTKENENLKNEQNYEHKVANNLSDKYNDAKSIIQTLLHEISDIDNFDNIFEAVFSKEKAKEYEVDNYIKEKYKVTKVKATKTITTNIYVLEKDNDNSYPEGVLENADEDLIDGYFGNYYDEEHEYEFEEKSVSAEGLTEDQVRSRYSQEQLFTANDCNDIWN